MRLIDNLKCLRGSEQRISGYRENATHSCITSRVVSHYFYKALITPPGAPRVLDKPIIKTRGGIIAVADYSHSMVGGGSTWCAVDYSTCVVQEHIWRCLNCNCDWGNCYSVHQSSRVVLPHTDISFCVKHAFWCVVLALLLVTNIGIVNSLH